MICLRRKYCAILPLVLTSKWFNMIRSGEKREEYRLATEYWQRRFFIWNAAVSPQKAPVVEFRRGYSKNAPRMAFWCYGLNTYAFVSADDNCKLRHPDWGEPDNAHFVIKLGERVELTDESEVPND